MQVIKRVKGYAQDPNRYFHLADYASRCGDFVLIEAGFSKPLLWEEYGFTPGELARIKSKKIVRIEFDEPNKLYVGDYPWTYDGDFYKILTLCPYTADWLNKKYKQKKRIPIFFPIHERYIPPKRKKTIDIIYSGHIYAKELHHELSSMRTFNYSIVSNSNDPIVTHPSVSYKKKMELYSESKITLVHNILFKPYFHRILNVWMSGDFWNNKAFAHFPVPWKPWELFTKSMHVPQLKSRPFEAAVSRSLILCMRDEFNIIERFFEPGKEFVYYEPGTLEQTVAHILQNYGDYETIINRAYNRAIKQYTMKSFVKKYLTHIV